MPLPHSRCGLTMAGKSMGTAMSYKRMKVALIMSNILEGLLIVFAVLRWNICSVVE